MTTGNDRADDRARMEEALARLVADTGAFRMTPAEMRAERESGVVTLRGLLAGVYFDHPPGHC